MAQKICAFTSLTDAVIRGLPYNEYCIKSVIGNKYSVEEMEIAFAIRKHDWMTARRLASQHLCDQFESKASADLSEFNRVIGYTVPECKYPTPGQIYDEVMLCIQSATDEEIRSISTEQAHKICASIAKNEPWYISFKSMIVFKVYKLWYDSVTAGHPHPPPVEVHCTKKPDMPEHWVHFPNASTAYSTTPSKPYMPSVQEVPPPPQVSLAYEEDWGWYNANDKSGIRIYYQSKAIAKAAF